MQLGPPIAKFFGKTAVGGGSGGILAKKSMQDMKAHPYTQAVIDAWKRLSQGQSASEGPTAEDFPGLVGRLFVLMRMDDGDYSFRRVGAGLEQLFGRSLTEHNFLSLWGETDRALVNAALKAAEADKGPALITARGETLDGRRVSLEFALAPLLGSIGSPVRFLGLCQSVTPDALLAGRPLRRLQATALYPPAPEPIHAAIRIVSRQ